MASLKTKLNQDWVIIFDSNIHYWFNHKHIKEPLQFNLQSCLQSSQNISWEDCLLYLSVHVVDYVVDYFVPVMHSLIVYVDSSLVCHSIVISIHWFPVFCLFSCLFYVSYSLNRCYGLLIRNLSYRWKKHVVSIFSRALQSVECLKNCVVSLNISACSCAYYVDSISLVDSIPLLDVNLEFSSSS